MKSTYEELERLILEWSSRIYIKTVKLFLKEGYLYKKIFNYYWKLYIFTFNNIDKSYKNSSKRIR